MAENMNGGTPDTTEENIRVIENILSVLDELEKKGSETPGKVDREALRAHLARLKAEHAKRSEEQAESARLADMKAEIARLQSELRARPEEGGTMYDRYRRGDNSLVLEGVYNGLSDEIKRLAETVRRELGYAYQQELAIYNDLSSQLSSVDPDKLAEKITEVSQLKATDIKVLEEKLSRVGEIDYDELSRRVAERLALPGAIGAIASSGEIGELKAEIEELRAALGARKEGSEFSLLDYEIGRYAEDPNKTVLSDVLVEARDLKLKAKKYLDNGNPERADEIVAGVRARLSSAVAVGSEAALEIERLAAEYRVPIVAEPGRLTALAEVFRKYEEASVLPDDGLMNDVIRAKRDAFRDSELTTKDKETFVEITGLGTFGDLSEIDDDTAARLRAGKRELLSFRLSAAFDFDLKRAGSDLTDTDLLLTEIRSLRSEIASGAPVRAASRKGEEEDEEKEQGGDLAGLVPRRAGSRPAAAKKFRPAVSGKDSKVEKKAQPLAVRRNKISLTKNDDPDILANAIVRQVAENMAKTRLK